MSGTRETRYGPWLVALGAALWGTESAWRIPLDNVFDADVMVLWEHVILVACALPFILPRLGELRRARWQTLAWLGFSGVAGSAVGTIFFTLALKRETVVSFDSIASFLTGIGADSAAGAVPRDEVVNATVINVVLNIQPVLSTAAAWLFFRDRLARGFYPWAALAVGCGVVLAIGDGHVIYGVHYALLTALLWGLSTVAGRGVMVELSLPLAAGMRVVIGLVATFAIVAVRGGLSADALWPVAADAAPGKTITWLLLLAILSGGLPLVIYFAGLARTRASTAGYFEMLQTLAAAAITWTFFGDALAPHQLAAGLVLIGAVAMVQRAQSQRAHA
jgi:drug/metabolite transporter (DMT)-like permease